MTGVNMTKEEMIEYAAAWFRRKGFRKSHLRWRKSDGVFTKEFREKVLSEKPDCDARTLKQAARKAWRQLEVEKKIEYEDKAHEQNVARLREQL